MRGYMTPCVAFTRSELKHNFLRKSNPFILPKSSIRSGAAYNFFSKSRVYM